MKYFLPLLIILCSCSSPALLNDSDYMSFGDEVIQLIKQSNTKELQDLYYPKKTFDLLEDTLKATGLHTRVNSAKRKSYKIELLDHFKEYIQLHSSHTNDSTNIELSKFYVKNNTPHIIVTIESKTDLEIIDFELLNTKDKIYISNFQTYNTGIDLSELFIWDVLNSLQYGQYNSEYSFALEELNNAYVYLTRNQPERALIAYKRIPEYFEHQSHFQNIKTQIAYQLSDSLYQDALYNWIGNNWDNKGFRYLKGFQYHLYFQDSTRALLYGDSLVNISGSDLIRSRMNILK